MHQQLCWKDHKNALILAFAQVDYLNEETGTWKTLHQEQHVKNNLALLLQWSPFSTEAELLKQVRMNLWNCFPSFPVIFFSKHRSIHLRHWENIIYFTIFVILLWCCLDPDIFFETILHLSIFLILSCPNSSVQFDDIGRHGTKIIVYSLWHNDEGKLELDFKTDPEVCAVS